MKAYYEKSLSEYKSKVINNFTLIKYLFLECLEAKDLKAIELILNILPSPSYLKLPASELEEYMFLLVREDTNIKIVKTVLTKIGLDLSHPGELTGTTLLHQAVSFGSLQIATFLLDIGFNPNVQDNIGTTPLHRAASFNKLALAKLLVSRGANLNILDKNKFSPLYTAAILKHKDIEAYLLNMKSNTNIKSFNNLKYFDLKKGLTKGIIKFNSSIFQQINLDVPKDPEADYYKGIASFTKACLGDTNNNINYVNEAIAHLKKTILNSSINENISLALSFLIDMNKIFPLPNSENLEKFIISKATLLKDYSRLTLFYHIQADKNLNNSEYDQALKYGKLTLYHFDTSQAPLPLKIKSKTLFNLGLTAAYTDLYEALEYFKQMEQLGLKPQKAIEQKLLIYIKLANYINAVEEAKKLKDKELKDLYLINLFLKLNPFENYNLILNNYNFKKFEDKIEEIKISKNKNKFSLYIDILASKFISEGNYSQAISLFKEATEIMPTKIISIALRILDLCKDYSLWQEGFEFLLEFSDKYNEQFINHRNFLLKYNEFIFYEVNGFHDKALNYLSFLQKHQHLGPLISELVEKSKLFIIFSAIEEKNVEKAENWVNELDQNFKIKFLYLLKVLKEEHFFDQAKESDVADKTSDNNIDPVNLDIDLNTSIATLDWAQDEEEVNEIYDLLDPKAIHAYFQQQKQSILQHKIETPISKIVYSWQIQNVAYSTGQKEIYEIQGRQNFYATISPELAKSLDNSQLQIFMKALEKGEVSKTYGSNGIKFIPHKLVELKINGDKRLFTNELFKNEDEKYLIVFNQSGTHKDVKRELQSKIKMKTTEVPKALYNFDFSSPSLENDYKTEYNSIEEAKLSLTGDIDSIHLDEVG